MAQAAAELLLCCCAGCIRGSDESTELYLRLGLLPSATDADIRKAWRVPLANKCLGLPFRAATGNLECFC